MNRRRSLTSVALTLASLGVAAAIDGCSAAPAETTEGTTSALYDPVGTGVFKDAPDCETPFTSLYRKEYVSNGSVEYGPLGCWPVTYSPDPGSDGVLFTFSTSTPIPPPPALADLGCTWGVTLAGIDQGGVSRPYTANFWACPANAAIPTQLTTLPACDTQGGSVLPPFVLPPCEFDSFGTSIDANSAIGAPMLGWQLVEEGVDDTDGGIVHGCGGGCANVLQ